MSSQSEPEIVDRMQSHAPPKNLSSHYSEMPDRVRENLILRRKIWPRMNVFNENWMCFLAGETGDGKSYAAL
ncbi:hypothetical protein DVK01_21090, partial [Haloarcula sp. Atlit-120R]